MPQDFLKWFTVVHSICTVFALGAIASSARRSRSRMLQLVISFLTFIIFLWLHVLSVFIQNGNRAVGCVFVAAAACALICAAYIVMQMFLLPVYMLGGQEYETIMRRGKIAAVFGATLLSVILFTAAGVSADESKTDLFNGLINGFQLGASLLTISAYIVLSITIGRLQEKLNALAQNLEGNGISRDTVLQANQRIRMLNMLLSAIVITFGIVLLPMMFIYVGLGSIPYQFVIWCAIMSGPLVSVPVITRFIEVKVDRSTFDRVRMSTTARIDVLRSSQLPY